MILDINCIATKYGLAFVIVIDFGLILPVCIGYRAREVDNSKMRSNVFVKLCPSKRIWNLCGQS